MTDTYTCSMCGETFEKGLTEEEAEQELYETFPGFDKTECDLVCDDCFHRFMGTNQIPS